MTKSEQIKKSLEEGKSVYLYRKGVFICGVYPDVLKQEYIYIEDNWIVVHGICIQFDDVEFKKEGN